MPGWVTEGFTEYAKRLPAEFSLELIEIPLGQRGKNADIERAIRRESDAILAAIDPQDYVVALEVKGKNWSTEQLAENMARWQMEGHSICLIIGGPDGLDRKVLERAQQKWSLSALTLPHPLVRIVLIEQIYRAISLLNNHPYHK